MANTTIHSHHALPENMLLYRSERDGVLFVSPEEGQFPDSMAVYRSGGFGKLPHIPICRAKG